MAPSPSPYVPFSLSLVPAGHEVVLVATGDLDLSTADAVAEAVREQRAAGTREIVLDLRKVAFIDSTGLRVLLVLRDEARRDGHGLTLIEAHPDAQRIFSLTATQKLFAWRPPRPA